MNLGGAMIKNSVVIGETNHGDLWQIARIEDGEFSYIAKVHPNREGYQGQAHYENQEGQEIAVDDFEVLTCQVKKGEDQKSEENSLKKPKEKSSSATFIILMILIVGSVGLVGYLWFDKINLLLRFRRF